jgi:hypothetical protein
VSGFLPRLQLDPAPRQVASGGEFAPAAVSHGQQPHGLQQLLPQLLARHQDPLLERCAGYGESLEEIPLVESYSPLQLVDPALAREGFCVFTRLLRGVEEGGDVERHVAAEPELNRVLRDEQKGER